MLRFKTIRNPALTEAEKQQILSRIIALKEVLNGCSMHLEIGCEDYQLVQHLGKEIMDAGQTIAKSPFWGTVAHKIG